MLGKNNEPNLDREDMYFRLKAPCIWCCQGFNFDNLVIPFVI